jgi:Holliday junction resolvasome RuvABC DNA-binding subunit
MAEKREYTKHQLKIIDNYYKNADARASQNLQEIVTELYLATSEKKRAQLWERARKALVTLGFKEKMIDHIVSTGKPEVLAEHVKDILDRT